MNGFERRKEQMKETILRTAQELFQAYGFKKVSINDIASKAGISPVTIYNHFGSKTELVREVVKGLFSSMMERYDRMIKEDKPFPEKLEAIVFDKTQIASQFQGELLQTIYQSDPELRRFFDSLWQNEIAQMTIDLIEDGKRQGYVNPKTSVEAVMLYLQILRNGVAASTEVFARLEPNVKLFRELNFLFLHGLVGKTG